MTVTASTKMNPEEDHEETCEEARAWDDVTGEDLDPKQVMRARLKELEYVREKGVWSNIKRVEAKARGFKIIGAHMWIEYRVYNRQYFYRVGDPKFIIPLPTNMEGY